MNQNFDPKRSDTVEFLPTITQKMRRSMTKVVITRDHHAKFWTPSRMTSKETSIVSSICSVWDATKCSAEYAKWSAISIPLSHAKN